MMLEPDQPLDDNFAVKFLGDYTVGIHVQLEYPEEGVKPAICSGFFVEVNDKLLIATAGHFIKELVDGVNNGHFTVASMQLLDCLGQNPRDPGGYPVNYEALFCTHAFSKELGIDIGFILMPEFYQEGIRANGVKALRPVNFKSPTDVDFDKFMLAGIPFQTLEPDDGSMFYQTVVTTLHPTDDPPPELIHKFERFYAKVADLGHIDDIEGMSGGPIFGFKKLPSGEAIYALVGLQNSWLKKEKCIAACPGDAVIPFFNDHIRAAMERSKAVD